MSSQTPLTSSSTLNIRNIPVNFPYHPYTCQVNYMDKVMQALQQSSNALLESPTGTGKTLCLLCASLAWQSQNKPNIPLQLGYNNGPSVENVSRNPSVSIGPATQTSVIIYASRTHSQLAQVVSELKSTSYHPRVAVLGSREQMCIHEKISQLKGGALNHACNSTNAQRRCMYKNNLDTYNGSIDIGIQDIEQLVTNVGHRDRVCPYFFSREQSKNAELILLPYNYLLEHSIRNTLKIEWQNAVVIFDEAHNLERIAADAASLTISSIEIAQCIVEFQQVLRILQLTGADMTTNSSNSSQSMSGGKGDDMKKFNMDNSSMNKPSIQTTARLLKALFSLEQRIDAIPLSHASITGSSSFTPSPHSNSDSSRQYQGFGHQPLSCVLPGSALVEMLENSGFRAFQVIVDIEEIRRCVDLLLEEAQNALQGGGPGTTMAPSEPKLVQLGKLLSRAFRGRTPKECIDLSVDYKLYICEEHVAQGSSKGGSGPSSSAVGLVGKKKRVLNYWCFSPGVAMEDLKKLGVRSILVTSGTLSPMETYREDLKLPFPIMLENPHVIRDNQIWVGALTAGPNGRPLNSSYSNRDSVEYKDELGASILRICITMAGHGGGGTLPVGPELKGGVLTFFPSYGNMDAAIQRWTTTGLFNKLKDVMGNVVVEPRGSAGAPSVSSKSASNWKSSGSGNDSSSTSKKPSQAFGFQINKSAIPSFAKGAGGEDEEAGAGEGGLGGVVAEFESSLKKFGKCLLFAVCRGKVSEGIDFKDAKGRVAIITGIPFAPPNDPWVALKKQYLDNRCSNVKMMTTLAHSSSTSSSMKVNSSSIYGNNANSNSVLNPVFMSSNNPQSANTYIPNTNTRVTSNNPAVGLIATASKPVEPLNGQSWYVQTASRAVNQALGRVIRHRTDWGAVFLLDDRYQSDRQRAQLSGWVRPRLQAYTQYGQAINEFRKFITQAMENPELNMRKKEIEEVLPRRPLRDIPRPMASNAVNIDEFSAENVSKKDFSKTIEISASLVLSNQEESDPSEGLIYIDPSYLLSQRDSPAMKTPRSFLRSENATNQLHISDSNRGVNNDDNESGDANLDLNEFINRIKEDITTKSYITPSTSSRDPLVDRKTDNDSLVQDTNEVQSNTVRNIAVRDVIKSVSDFLIPQGNVLAQRRKQQEQKENLQNSRKLSVNGDGHSHAIDLSEKSSQIGTGLSLGESLIGNVGDCCWDLKNPGNRSKTIINVSGKNPGEVTSSQEESSSKSSANISHPIKSSFQQEIQLLKGKDEFRKFIDNLKKVLPMDDFRRLKSLILSLKGDGGVKDVSQVRSFADSVFPILKSLGMDPATAGQGTEWVMLQLASLLPIKFNDLYCGIVRKLCQVLRAKATSDGNPSLIEIKRKPQTLQIGFSQGKIETPKSVSSSAKSVSGTPSQHKNDLSERGSDTGISSSKAAHIIHDADKRDGAHSSIGRDLDATSNKHAIIATTGAMSAEEILSSFNNNEEDTGGFSQQTSKRARSLLSQATVKQSANPQFNSKSMFSKLMSLEVTKGPKSVTGTSNQATDGAKKTRIMCAICQDNISTEPYAARSCGHICCKPCWSKWFKIKQVCPVCRNPTTADQVAGIILK